MAFTQHTVALPLGPDGLHGSRNLAVIPETYLAEATNITYESGTLQKEGGTVAYNATAISGTPRVAGGWDWDTNALAQRMIIGLSDGTLRKDSGTGTFPVTLASSMSGSLKPYFVEGGAEQAGNNRKLFIFLTTNPIQVLADDGATTSTLATPPADWSGANQPTVGVLHEGRLWGAGNPNDPHRMYYSTLTNHEDFTGAGAGSLSVFPGHGQRIIGLLSYNDYLLVFKRRGIYILDTRSGTAANWRVRRLTEAVGILSAHAIVPVDHDVLFMDSTGAIQALSAVQEFGDIGGRNVSQGVGMDTFMRADMALDQLAQVKAVYYLAKREVHFAYAPVGTAFNTKRLVIDLNRDTPRYRVSSGLTIDSLWLHRDSAGIPRPVYGDNLGKVWRMDQTARSRNGLGYTGRVRTASTDLGFVDQAIAHKYKNLEFLELFVEPVGNYGLHVSVLCDDHVVDTVSFGQSGMGSVFGTAIFGEAIFGSTGLISQRRRIEGRGKRIALDFNNTGINENFSVASARLSFNVGDE